MIAYWVEQDEVNPLGLGEARC